MDKKAHNLTYDEQLNAFAVANKKAVIEKETEDYILIKIKLEYSNITQPLVKWLKPRTHKTYQLFGLGLEVYREITRNQVRIRNLVYWLRDTYKLSFYEARNLIIQYTGDLIRHGIIIIEAE